MKKYLRTLFCAALVSLPGAGHVFSSVAAAPLVLPPATNKHLVTSGASTKPSNPARTQTGVDVYITLPYQGLDNGWDVVFVNIATGDRYEYSTDGTAERHLLGYVDSGVYNVYFDQTQGQHSYFDFYVGCDQTDYYVSPGHGLVGHATIGENCDVITIDRQF